MEKKGIATDRGNINREVKHQNAILREILRRIKALLNWIRGIGKEEKAESESIKFTLSPKKNLQSIFENLIRRNADNNSADLEKYIESYQLLKEKNMHALIKQTYDNCRNELKKPVDEMTNCVQQIYKAVTVDEINQKIVQMLRPQGVSTPIELVFQSIEGLHEAIPNHKGDWYFTGDYPTPGGMRLCNQAFVNFIEKVYQNEQKF